MPLNFSFKNSKYVKPLHGAQLANELKKHHGYITASINEPGGIIKMKLDCVDYRFYMKSGCLPEYCGEFGVSFNEENFEKRLVSFKENYDTLVNKIKNILFQI